MSKDGIRIEPLKIKSILALPVPTNITKFQSLQGKENFLRCFICNYAEKTHGFMHLLNKDTPFVWDDLAQHALLVAVLVSELCSVVVVAQAHTTPRKAR